MSKHVAIVTGGSSGIGLSTARALHRAGYVVYEFSRRDRQDEWAHHVTADITDEQAVGAAVSEVLSCEGQIDLVVNNAGGGISGAIEFTRTEDAQRLMDLNFFGMVRVNRAVIPIMRSAGCGRIINISSVGGPVPLPFQAFYSASKAAVNAYSLALANELRPFGIQVVAVQPGDIATGFTAARKKLHQGEEIYQGRIGRSVGRMEKDEQGGMSPDTAGRFIARVARRRYPAPVVTIGLPYKLVMLLLRLLPQRLVNWILYWIYAR